ncbi:MAG: inorganic phosphate transporter, partial [Terriglobales bacterium]
ALLSSIIWNFAANKLKMPASSTHALIGGMIGALFAGDWSFDHVRLGKFDPIHPTGVIGAAISIVMSPMLGFLVAYFLFSLTLICILRATSKAESVFRRVQWITTAGLAFGDGQNDTQKTMGLLVLALNCAGLLHQNQIPLWVRALTGLAMAVGAFALSPSVAKELAFKVYKLRPMHAAVAETSATSILVANSIVGGPVSASQVIAAAIMGTGGAERARGIHWMVIKDMLLSWIITIPATAVLALLAYVAIFRWLGLNL